MLGSHDTYTYLGARNKTVNAFSEFWRCQNESVSQQYKKGVRYFDVRVKREVGDDGKTVWRTCHGLAEFSKTFANLKSICVYFTSTLKGSKIRLVLEKGSTDDEEAFEAEIAPLTAKYDCLDRVCIKKPWRDIYTNKNFIKICFDNTYEEWDFVTVTSKLLSSPIKDNAKDKNPEITQEIIDSPDLYFLDYCTNNF